MMIVARKRLVSSSIARSVVIAAARFVPASTTAATAARAGSSLRQTATPPQHATIALPCWFSALASSSSSSTVVVVANANATAVRFYSSTRPLLDSDGGNGSHDGNGTDEEKKKKQENAAAAATTTTTKQASSKEETKTTTESKSNTITGSRYQTINNPGLTDEEIDAIFAEEEARVEAEKQAKFMPNWKPGMRKRPLQFSFNLEDFEYEAALLAAGNGETDARWTLRDRRCGALAIKVGMMPLFDHKWGVRYPCTILLVDSNIVLGHKTADKHGYNAVRIAAGQRKRKNVGKSVLGQYQGILEKKDNNANNENPPYLIREFRVSSPRHLPPLHSRIHARHFCPGQNVDVSGISKGKGFAGAMKLHNFGGMPASHGVSRSHRALGSTGQCQDPGRVFRGKKMAGRMGTDRVTVQNLRVLQVDRGRNLLYVLGAVPGNKGAFVEVRDAVKKPLWKTDKVENAVDRPPLPTFDYDESIDGCGQAGFEVFMPSPLLDPLDPDTEENQETTLVT